MRLRFKSFSNLFSFTNLPVYDSKSLKGISLLTDRACAGVEIEFGLPGTAAD